MSEGRSPATPRSFSDFIRNATPEEKEAMYTEVMKAASEKQNAALAVSATRRMLVPVEPAPTYIESSGRWSWPLPEHARFVGCCTEVVTASREWWEYAPSEAKPHPTAEAVQLRDGWYWVVPFALSQSRPKNPCNTVPHECVRLECASSETCVEAPPSSISPRLWLVKRTNGVNEIAWTKSQADYEEKFCKSEVTPLFEAPLSATRTFNDTSDPCAILCRECASDGICIKKNPAYKKEST